MLSAVDLRQGQILWQSAIGTLEEITPLHLALHTGTPTFGGPLVTASGLVFIASTLDKYLRAFDARSGHEIWQGHLPAPAQATPMTFEYQGRQMVVIAAGGHRDTAVPQGETAVVAFALPQPGEPGPTLRARTFDRPGGRFAVQATLLVLALVGASLAARRLLAGRR